MPRSAPQWHARFHQQAAWTAPTRRYLIHKIGLSSASRVLEVGCGTGAITSRLVEETGCQVFGLDLHPGFLLQAVRMDLQTHFCRGNALSLPFPDSFFHAVVCHYLLLWTPDPFAVLAEMTRVALPGGAVIAFAEPDYSARIDYPPELAELGKLQADALCRQGAEPTRGRQLAALFAQTSLDEVETGVMGNRWGAAPTRAEIDAEWEILEDDLQGTLPASEMERLYRIDQQAWKNKSRVLFIPTFFACGTKNLMPEHKIE